MDKNIVVSGIRPTGKMHLGNYFGALKNFVALQETHKCYFFIADLHALTTAYDKTQTLAQDSRNMLIDWLTAGLDPKKCTMFIQSHVPQISELTTLLGMLTPLGWLLRNPTYKEQLNEIFKKKYAGQTGEAEAVNPTTPTAAAEKMALLTEKEISEMSSFGFLGYPVLMATDILIHKAQYVPVGQDQIAHLEISRDIARRFNDMFKADILVEPKPLLTAIPKVPGLDGRKMSKSYGNTIELGEDVESVRKKVMAMFTDPNKKRASDPGNPDGCTAFAFHKIYNPQACARYEECKSGALGCVACKKQLFELMEPELKAFNERRQVYSQDNALLDKIIKEGAQAAEASAAATLKEVQKTMNLCVK
ncbi:MAG: tryptophan--tRNA ligase [Elusimicrobiota bacterium]|jgi:tryptophanyl-tRNA synthetase|nr:tryptophan--tRNA ligase [Elusimicrobiota bacterium]